MKNLPGDWSWGSDALVMGTCDAGSAVVRTVSSAYPGDMRRAWRNVRSQRHWKLQLALRLVGVALMGLVGFFGGPLWAVFGFAVIVLASTVLYVPEAFRRGR